MVLVAIQEQVNPLITGEKHVKSGRFQISEDCFYQNFITYHP